MREKMGCDQLPTHLLVAQIEELVELDSTVRKCAECTFLLEISSDLRIGDS
jgi:hypothetical protein